MMDWLKYKYIYFIVSGLLIVASITSLIFFQLKPGIDFVGGTLIVLSAEKEDKQKEKVRKILDKHKVKIESLQEDKEKKIVVKTEFIKQDTTKKIREALGATESGIVLERFETVGPILGRELLNKTFTAAVIAVIGMLIYIAWTFKNFRFGAAAVLALLHDTLVLVGSFSLLGHFYQVEVDALFVTAVLTTMSFSVHDTVVVFNKIREKLKESGSGGFTNTANEALTETMVRSINNSLTIIFMLLALILLGGETIRWFMVALLIGTVLGTYSSPFVAVPILSLLQKEKN